jgi:soluble lytic murein transglycosylase
MLIRIISLVFLFVATGVSTAIHAEDAYFVYPKKKPSVFKKINKKILPLTKPKANKKPIKINKDFVLPKDKPVKEKEKIIVEKTKKIEKKQTLTKNININKFIYPQKKPKSYKSSMLKEAKLSSVVSKKDFEKTKEVLKFVKLKKWNSALKLTKKIKDKEFRNLITWMYLKQKGNRATFAEYQVFITRNSDYPRINRLRYLSEHKIILKNTTPNAIINWFEKEYPNSSVEGPLSGVGKIKLGEAYMLTNKTEKAVKLIKEGWVNAELSKNDLRYYRKKFRKILNSEDHIKRADYLAWNSKYWDLKRMLRYLPKDEKALYNARQILMSNSYGVDKSISNVPSHLKKNIGLQYDRLKWRNRRGRLDSSLQILHATVDKTEEYLVRPDLWWKQRQSVVRTLIYKKKYKLAYKVASEHSLNFGPEFAEAEWLSGWIALSFLDSPEYAITHFDNFYNNVGYPISLARGAYWLGRSYKALGDKENSKKYFKEGSAFLTTYYGQLSFNEINYGGEFTLKDQSNYSKEYEKEFNENKLIKHVILLKELDRTQYSKDIIKHLASLNIEKGSEVLAAKLATKIGRYDFAIQISKQASYEKRFYNQFNYPIITVPREINGRKMPESELILAIIRQESEFDTRANSYVGARGMMQLMKYTAKIVAKQAKLPYSISRLTKDPEYNIKLGSYYFNSLLQEYNGVYPFAIAAYNAGPNRVKTWRRINGDPSRKQINYIDWIELIRFEETRNYVQRVLENINVYKYMIRQAPVKINRFFQ